MNRKPAWWKLYLFAALGCVGLFLIPPTNHTAIIVWMIAVYGGIGVWLLSNQQPVDATVDYLPPVIVTAPIAEFFDEDRIQLQQTAAEIPDDNRIDSSHEVI